MDKKQLEEGLELAVQYDKRGGQVPVVVQDHVHGVIHSLGYANSQALQETLAAKQPHLQDPSKRELWPYKNLAVAEVLVDCDQDALIYRCVGNAQDNFRPLASPNDIQFDEKGLVPVIAQEIESKDVLMLGYANRQAVDTTVWDGYFTLWSTSRSELWTKGKTSGDYLVTKNILLQNEGDAVLCIVKMLGHGACHTKTQDKKTRKSCFYRRIAKDKQSLEFLQGMQ